eukprot:COSAG01_NODE_26101_length_723_cov_1.817308_1_plen_181_part_00
MIVQLACLRIIVPLSWGIQQCQIVLEVIVVLGNGGSACLLIAPISEIEGGLRLAGHGVLPAPPQTACQHESPAESEIEPTSSAQAASRGFAYHGTCALRRRLGGPTSGCRPMHCIALPLAAQTVIPKTKITNSGCREQVAALDTIFERQRVISNSRCSNLALAWGGCKLGDLQEGGRWCT